MTIRRRPRLTRMAAMRRSADRKNQSICLVVIFLAFFACIVVTEVFLVEKDTTSETALWNRFYKDEQPVSEKYPEDMTPRVARELNRIPQEDEISSASVKKKFQLEYNGTAWYEDKWQGVKGAKDKFYVFSAYYDDRKTRTIRIIAAARTRIAERVTCVFWFGNGEEPATVYATNKLIRENWNLKYSAYFLLCPLRRDIASVPKEVSIVKPGSGQASNRLLIHNNKIKYKEPKGLAVCVKPMHYSYNKMLDFVEFVELNRLMGASHFILYNHTVGPNVSCALDHYKQRGLVTLLPWQLEMTSQKEIRTEGLFAALNDCLYRTMYRFRYVLMIDFDEFVVPHSNNSLTSMLNYLTSRNPARIGAYSFQNAFFYLQWPNDTKSRELPLPLLTLRKTKRKSRLHAHKQRSKCVVLPERVVEMGNHFVWEFMPGKIMQNVHPDTAFLHHYRVCEFGGSDCINTTSTVDRRIYTWKEELIKSVTSILAAMQGLVCGKTITARGTTAPDNPGDPPDPT